LTLGDGTESVDIQITINNPWPSVADFEADDRYDPFVVEYSFDETEGSTATKFEAVRG
jgi:hypothetical protein